MMSTSCIGAAALVVVTLTGCGSGGPDLFAHDGMDGTDVDRADVDLADVDLVDNPDRSLSQIPNFITVTGAADGQVNGVYGKVKSAVWKLHRTGARFYRDDFGAGKGWCCPNNNQVWWIGYGGHGRYFNCDTGPVPPVSNWQVRNQPNFWWSAQYGQKPGVSGVALQSSSPKLLDVSDAADPKINGVYRVLQRGVWKNDNTGARITKSTFGAGETWCCPRNTQVWWMGYGGDSKYFHCATGSFPPVSDWRARNQGGLQWSKDYAGKSVPEVAFLSR